MGARSLGRPAKRRAGGAAAAARAGPAGGNFAALERLDPRKRLGRWVCHPVVQVSLPRASAAAEASSSAAAWLQLRLLTPHLRCFY